MIDTFSTLTDIEHILDLVFVLGKLGVKMDTEEELTIERLRIVIKLNYLKHLTY